MKLKSEAGVKIKTPKGPATVPTYSCVTMRIQAKNAAGDPVDVECHEPFIKGELPVLGTDQFKKMEVKVEVDYVNNEVTITKVGA